jgi:hypothetical protein
LGRLAIRSFLGVALYALTVGCDAPLELQPDAELRDAFGLTSRDRVHTVTLHMREGRETARPETIDLLPGDWVAFRSGDGFVRSVEFEVDSLDETARAWVRARGVEASPPLLSLAARWVVHFEDAPPGRYRYRLEGNRAQGYGAVEVGARSRIPFYNP